MRHGRDTNACGARVPELPPGGSRPWRRWLILLSVLALVLGLAAPAMADTAGVTVHPGVEIPQHLFSGASSPLLAAQAADLTVMRERAVTVELDSLGDADSPAHSVTLNLFDGTLYTAMFDRSETNYLGSYIWIGHLEGVELGQAVLAITNGLLAGTVSMPGAIYQVLPSGGGAHAVRQLDQSAFPAELATVTFEPTETSRVAGPVLAAGDTCDQITVLVAYSPEARAAAGGTAEIQATIALAVAETNQSYVNSGLTQRIVLVHSMETSPGDATNGFSTDLQALQNLSDGIFDDLDAARETYYADEVVLVIENRYSCGLAYLNSTAASAFSVVHRGCATGYYSFGHGLGENMGARYDWYVDDQPYYHKGFVNLADSWRTIMAYNDYCRDFGSGWCTRLQYWSNPDVSYAGDPMGVVSTGPKNCVEGSTSPDPSTCAADNRTRLNETCSTVANFRSAPATGDITAHKFNDLNANGVLDAGEPGLSGWTVTLYGGHGCDRLSLLDSGVTDGSGNKSFTSLVAGSYSISETLQTGWQTTVAPCQNVTLAAGGSEIVNVGNQAVPGSIEVAKTAGPTQVSEPGGSVQFTVRVDNASVVRTVTIDALVDSIHGDLNGQGDCSVPQTIPAGGYYECSFGATVTGNAGYVETDMVAASGTDDDGNPVSDDDDATVTLADVPSSIEVHETADPTEVAEPGGLVQFTVRVDNTSAVDAVTIDTLSASVHGDLNGQGTCAVPQTVPAGGYYECSFSATVSGNAGYVETDVVAASGDDDDGNPVNDDDDTTVTVSDVPSSIEVHKTADPTEVAEPGGVVQFTVRVDNTSAADSVTMASLSDSIHGDLNGQGDCAVQQIIPAGGYYECSFSATVSGNAGHVETDVVTASGDDDDGNPVSDDDDATVTLADVPSSIEVHETADPTEVTEPGGLVQFTVRVDNTSAVDSVTIDNLSDSIHGDLNGQGGCTVPQTIPAGGHYECSFGATVSGNAGHVETDVVMASGDDDDGNPVSDDDDATVTLTDVPSSIEVHKTADPTEAIETGTVVTFTVRVSNTSAVDEILLDTLTDTVHGDLDGQGDCSTPQSIPVGGSYECTFTATLSGEAGYVETNWVTASGTDDDGVSVSDDDDATVTVTSTTGFFIWLREAENAPAVSIAPILPGLDPDASNCVYLHCPVQGRNCAVVHAFAVPQSGGYYLWTRSMGLGWSSNSFLLSLDGGPDIVHIIPKFGGEWRWGWNRLAAGAVLLRKGRHTLRLKVHEPGARLDRLLITDNPELVPVSAAPCESGSSPAAGDRPLAARGFRLVESTPGGPTGASGPPILPPARRLGAVLPRPDYGPLPGGLRLLP